MRAHTGAKGMQRAELAQRTGCNLETVRYYEKAGLLPEPPRTSARVHRLATGVTTRRTNGVFASYCGLANSAFRCTRSAS